MLLERGYIERRMGQDLGLRLVVQCTDQPDLSTLSAQEVEAAPDEGPERRRQEWLTGRTALKRVLGRLGLSTDMLELSFPHPRLSLTHASGIAVAVGSQRDQIEGIGVDLQTGRTPSREALRFFLSPQEQAWVAERGPLRDEDALRLWTVKEALFKSDPHNQGKILHDYRVEDPECWVGTARDLARTPFRYSTMAVDEGFLTVAVHGSQS